MGEVARVTEITARSSESFEDAIRTAIERASQTLRNVSGAWVKEQKVEIQDGRIHSYHVDLMVTFVLDGNMDGNGHMAASAARSSPSQMQQSSTQGASQTTMAPEREVEGVRR